MIRAPGPIRSSMGSVMKTLPRIASFLCVLLLATAAHAGGGTLGFTVDFSADRTLLDAKLKQVRVTDVAPASPAERAGMKKGDLLDRLDGRPLAGSSARRFFDAMGRIEPGQKVVLVVLRDGKPVTLTLVAR